MTAPNDYIARWLASQGVFPQAMLQAEWGRVQQTGQANFLLGLVKLGHLPMESATELMQRINDDFYGSRPTGVSGEFQLPPQSALSGPSSGVLPVADVSATDVTIPSAQQQDLVHQAKVATGRLTRPTGAFNPPPPIRPTGRLQSSDELANSQTVFTSASKSASKSASQSRASSLSMSGDYILPDLERYEVEKELSRGGMGVVLIAKPVGADFRVALKLMLTTEPDPEELERFELEARALSKLKHPGIVSVRDYGRENGYPFMAMDLVQGRDLKSIIDESVKKTGKVPDFAWTLKTFKQIAEALYYCHGEGLIHRDLKPVNILIENDTDQPVIVDFGLAKKTGDQDNMMSLAQGLTAEGQTLGTPSYMPPEQLDNEKGQITEKSDAWGFGATLFYALTGETPYGKLDVMQIYKALLTRDPRNPADVNPEIPPELEALCQQCLQRDQSLRPTMDNVCDLLQREVQLDAAINEANRRRSSFRRNALVSMLSLVVVLVFGLYFAVQPKNPVIQLNEVRIKTLARKYQDRAFDYRFEVDVNRWALTPTNGHLEIVNLLTEEKRVVPATFVGKNIYSVKIKLFPAENALTFFAYVGEDSESSSLKTTEAVKGFVSYDETPPILEPVTVAARTFEAEVPVSLKSIVNEYAKKEYREKSRELFKFSVKRVTPTLKSGKTYVYQRDKFAREHSPRLPLAFGENTFEITVEDRSGNTRTHKIQFERYPSYLVIPETSAAADTGYDIDFLKVLKGIKEAKEILRENGKLEFIKRENIRFYFQPGLYPETEWNIDSPPAFLSFIGLPGKDVVFENSSKHILQLGRDGSNNTLYYIENIKFTGSSIRDKHNYVKGAKISASNGSPAIYVNRSRAWIRGCTFLGALPTAVTTRGRATLGDQTATVSRFDTTLIENSVVRGVTEFGFDCRGSASVRLKNITIELNSRLTKELASDNKTIDTVYGSKGVRVTENSNCEIIDTKIIETAKAGMQISFGGKVVLENSTILKAHESAINVEHPKSRLWAKNCDFKSIGTFAKVVVGAKGVISMGYGSQGYLEDCRIIDSVVSGVVCARNGRIDMQSCRISGHKYYGLQIGPVPIVESTGSRQFQAIAIRMNDCIFERNKNGNALIGRQILEWYGSTPFTNSVNSTVPSEVLSHWLYRISETSRSRVDNQNAEEFLRSVTPKLLQRWLLERTPKHIRERSLKLALSSQRPFKPLVPPAVIGLVRKLKWQTSDK